MLVMFSHVRCGNTAKDLSTVGGGRLSGAEMRHYCRHSVCKTRVTSGLCFELGGKDVPKSELVQIVIGISVKNE